MSEVHQEVCFTCGQSYDFGTHRYRGKYIPAYQIGVCEICLNGNSDGWNPRLESKLIAHLKENRLPVPPRNAQGWLPRDG